MLHLLFDPKPWFADKRYGYGAGLPLAWQGRALAASYIAAMMGLGVLAERVAGIALAGPIALMAALTVGFVLIARARTRGGWRWRSGDDD